MNKVTDFSKAEQLDCILEALLFASEEPLSIADLAGFSGRPEPEVREGLKHLADRLEQSSALSINEIAGGFRLETRPDFYETIREMFEDKRATKLSMATLETLALIAYKQPITAIEVAELRMVTSVNTLIKNLLEKKLIKPAGRKKVVGRPMMYATTKEFLIHFGLNQLSDLPSLEDFQEKIAENSPPDESFSVQETDNKEFGAVSLNSDSPSPQEAPSKEPK